MANTFSNLGWSVVNSSIVKSTANTIVSSMTAYAQSWIYNSLINSKRGHLRFYVNKDMGGSVINVIAKNALATAADALTRYGIEEYKKAIGLKENKDIQRLIRNEQRWNLVQDEKRNQKKFSDGIIYINNKTEAIHATDYRGGRCSDAVMLAIPLAQKIQMKADISETADTNPYKPIVFRQTTTDKLVWWDCTGTISTNSSKSLSLTPVQGRDYSRKELISNGDFKFSISGTILSPEADVYPTSEVQKFIKIMNYKGIVEISYPVLNRLGINKILIESWSLPAEKGGKSKQEYNIECVGIQPDKEISITSDTIVKIDSAISLATTKSEKSWQDIIDAHVYAAKQTSVDVLTSVTNSIWNKIWN